MEHTNVKWSPTHELLISLVVSTATSDSPGSNMSMSYEPYREDSSHISLRECVTSSVFGEKETSKKTPDGDGLDPRRRQRVDAASATQRFVLLFEALRSHESSVSLCRKAT